jgi:type VI protein secretion system component Hcp
MQTLNLTKRTDRLTPRLSLAAASGQHIKSVELVTTGSSGDQLIVLMEDVLVDYVRAASGHDAELDEVGLNFGNVTFEHKPRA